MRGRYRPLETSFFDRAAETVARELLGAYLVSDCRGSRCVGRIVESEAYPGPHDPASHAAASIGRTARNDPMFGPPGTAYIHLNFGIHWCLNVVVGREGYPAAVLIRALEPVEGLETIRRRRPGRSDRELTSGPAKLTQALAVRPSLQRHRLTEPPLFLAAGEPVPAGALARSSRAGVTKGAEKKWRFYDRRSAWVSRKA
ncbi:MAG: DNA-3-methyladenine glycosylase [Gemmatimonadetes bacterium]|nr:DNA-3-methyladenine glycosylase [Gemmatimonadota bacterium]NIO30496.1 DNA-3-methyladenine glycosylase [Gemmatimonadota bacterium]